MYWNQVVVFIVPCDLCLRGDYSLIQIAPSDAN